MNEQLFKRIMVGKKVTYQPYTPPPLQLSDDMTEAQLVSCVGGLAVLAINGYQCLVPKHKRVATKIQVVKDKVLEMYKGTGAEISHEHIDFVCQAWDGTMRKLAGK